MKVTTKGDELQPYKVRYSMYGAHHSTIHLMNG